MLLYFLSGRPPEPDPSVKRREVLSPVALQGLRIREQAERERLERLAQRERKAEQKGERE